MSLQFLLLSTGICVGTHGLVKDELFKATLEAKCFVGGAILFSPEVNMIRLLINCGLKPPLLRG
ncbi:MAG: hypothetical protein SWX82_28805 [Cyanobacteriota bacterium]|nr:hypothetical protein [Cyanobacteriota bacterium]